MIDLGIGEEALGDKLIAAGSEIMTFEIAAAHVHADTYLGRARRNGLIDAVDIEIDQCVRIVAGPRDLFADCRIAKQRHRNLIELDITATSCGKFTDFLRKDCGKIGKECFDVRIRLTVRQNRRSDKNALSMAPAA